MNHELIDCPSCSFKGTPDDLATRCEAVCRRVNGVDSDRRAGQRRRREIASVLQGIYGEYITQGSPDDWYEDADRLLAALGWMHPEQPS